MDMRSGGIGLGEMSALVKRLLGLRRLFDFRRSLSQEIRPIWGPLDNLAIVSTIPLDAARLCMGYFDAQEGAQARTAFRTAEKLYKRYKNPSTNSRKSKYSKKILPPTDLSQVLDFNKYAEVLRDRTSKVDGVSLATGALLQAPVFLIDGHPGFYFIPQALSVEEQFCWIRESLTSFPQPPNRTNHNTVYGPVSDLWAHVQKKHVLVEGTATDQDGMRSGPTQEEIPDPSADDTKDEHSNKSLIAAVPVEVIATETPHSVEQLNCKEKIQTLLHDSRIPPSPINNALTPRVVHKKPEDGSTNWRFVDEAVVTTSSIDTKTHKD